MRRGLPAVLALLGGCGACDTPPERAVTVCEGVAPASPKTDILFVVDDSGSMGEEQANLAQNFQTFIATLAASPVRNDFQIGVTTTSVDQPLDAVTTRTTFNVGPNAGQPYPAGALVAVDASGRYVSSPRILRGDSPTLVADFQANVNVGTYGSGKEQGLRAALLAVTDRVADGQNAGFLRPEARLVLIVVSDEDDCSDPYQPPHVVGNPDQCHDPGVKNLGGAIPAGPTQVRAVDEYLADFTTLPLGGEVREVLVAAVVGVDQAGNPAFGAGSGCPTAFDGGDRYKLFAAGFGARGLLDSICDASFASTLEAIATLINQQVPLGQTPADWRLLEVSVTKPDGTRVGCRVGVAPDPGADVIYEPPTASRPATLNFQGPACTLVPGDRVDLRMLCAG